MSLVSQGFRTWPRVAAERGAQAKGAAPRGLGRLWKGADMVFYWRDSSGGWRVLVPAATDGSGGRRGTHGSGSHRSWVSPSPGRRESGAPGLVEKSTVRSQHRGDTLLRPAATDPEGRGENLLSLLAQGPAYLGYNIMLRPRDSVPSRVTSQSSTSRSMSPPPPLRADGSSEATLGESHVPASVPAWAPGLKAFVSSCPHTRRAALEEDEAPPTDLWGQHSTGRTMTAHIRILV